MLRLGRDAHHVARLELSRRPTPFLVVAAPARDQQYLASRMVHVPMVAASRLERHVAHPPRPRPPRSAAPDSFCRRSTARTPRSPRPAGTPLQGPGSPSCPLGFLSFAACAYARRPISYASSMAGLPSMSPFAHAPAPHTTPRSTAPGRQSVNPRRPSNVRSMSALSPSAIVAMK